MLCAVYTLVVHIELGPANFFFYSVVCEFNERALHCLTCAPDCTFLVIYNLYIPRRRPVAAAETSSSGLSRLRCALCVRCVAVRHTLAPVRPRSALQTLNRCRSLVPRPVARFDWVSSYEKLVSSDQSCLNEWHAMEDIQSRRPPSPDSQPARSV